MNLILKTSAGKTALAAMSLSIVVCVPEARAEAVQGGPAAITKVSTASVGTEAVVTIEANGPLPAPTVGTVDDPPRIFLDFVGIVPKVPARSAGADLRVRRVRVALNQVNPPVTRVVLDLLSPQPHRVEQAPGKVLVIVGMSAPAATLAAPTLPAATPTPESQPIPPVPDLPPPAAVSAAAAPPRSAVPPRRPDLPAPATSEPPARPTYRSATPSPSPKDLQKYKAQAGSTIDRLRLQQPLFDSLDSLEALPADRLEMALAELDRIQKDLAAIDPPETLRSQHDLLLQAARLGLLAVRIRTDAAQTLDPAGVRNAASAAAGAIMTLDRACADVGCAGIPIR